MHLRVRAVDAAAAQGNNEGSSRDNDPGVLASDDGAFSVIDVPTEFNPLIQQDVVHLPQDLTAMNDSNPIAALGFIETQGFTAVFDAIDTACKAADVEVIGKEKLGGGYVTVVVKGDVAAVKTAVAAGSQKVEQLGKLIAAHVVTRPSTSVLGLLPN